MIYKYIFFFIIYDINPIITSNLSEHLTCLFPGFRRHFLCCHGHNTLLNFPCLQDLMNTLCSIAELNHMRAL